MTTLPDSDSVRQSAVAELASITSLEFGTLSKIHRSKPSPDGAGVTRSVLFYKVTVLQSDRQIIEILVAGPGGVARVGA